MIKFILLLLLLTLLLFFILPVHSLGASHEVEVNLPSFAVTVNGTVVNSNYREYPFIVYRGITYFPMTYYDCRFLGFLTDWDSESGLAIHRADVSGPYHDYASGTRNEQAYKALICDFPVSVNGVPIDNKNEEYPLLNFRGVTYFPMTWRFCHDEFGWSYEFSNERGFELSIPVESIKLAQPDPVVRGGSVQLVPDIYPKNASTHGLIYKSSNEAVATVSQTGIISAVGAGNATVTLTAPNGVSASVRVSVIVPVTSVRIEIEDYRTLFDVNEIVNFNVVIFPDDATDKNVDIAVTGIELIGDNTFISGSSGAATIIATASNGVKGKLAINIIDLVSFADEIRQEFYILLNDHRTANGLRTLRENKDLQAYADIRAAEQRVLFGHTRPDGSAAGSGWHNSQNFMNTRYAENAYSELTLDFTDARASADIFFTGWKNSPGHNRHMLYGFDSNITMALGLDLEINYNSVTSPGIWATGY